MYICNLKLNLKKIFIVIAIIAICIALFIEINSRTKIEFDYILTEENFTTILQSVHDNIDENIGKTVKLSGFIFRLPDFKKGYFVCGRNMMYMNDEKVVGFLCSYDKDFTFDDSEWVEITGKFVKGYYMSDMPVIKVETITKIPAPINTFVKAPDTL